MGWYLVLGVVPLQTEIVFPVTLQVIQIAWHLPFRLGAGSPLVERSVYRYTVKTGYPPQVTMT